MVITTTTIKRMRGVVLPLSPCIECSLRLLEAIVVDGTSSVFPEEGGAGSGCRVSLEGVEVGTRGGVGVALVGGPIAATFRLAFLLCQRPCMNLLRVLGLAGSL